MNKLLTLCFISRGNSVLLEMKKRGFGVGRWNGIGGKVEGGESIEAAAQRELHEEIGVVSDELERRAILTFEFEGDPVVLEVHVFLVNGFRGEPTETDEMAPAWFERSEIPFDSMWPDDCLWLPALLAGECLRGDFLFRGMDVIVAHDLRTVTPEELTQPVNRAVLTRAA